MRHRNSGRKFDRNPSSRRAMFRNLAANLILHEGIETTDAKAKEIRRVVEKLITKAKRLGEIAYTPHDKLSAGDRARRLATERVLAAYLPRIMTKTLGTDSEERVDIVEKVFVDLSKRFAARAGGYTRIVKLGLRRGDNAPISKIEFVDGPIAGDKPVKAEKKAKAPKAETKAALSPADGAKAEKAEKAPKAEKAEKKPAKAKAEKTEK